MTAVKMVCYIFGKSQFWEALVAIFLIFLQHTA